MTHRRPSRGQALTRLVGSGPAATLGIGAVTVFALLWGTLAGGCAELPGGPQTGFSSLDSVPAPLGTGGVLSVRWKRRIVPEGEGPPLPVERSRPALDPSGGRLYVASTAGELQAFTLAGRRLYRIPLGSPVEAPLVLARDGQRLYVPTMEGKLLALRPESGERLWSAEVGGALRTEPRIAADAIYVVTEEDEVVAIGPARGEVLWRHRRERPEGFAAMGHAAPTLDGVRLLTGFTDGTVVALDRRDGTLLWERDTSLAIEERLAEEEVVLTDVDTTPVLRKGRVYVASFAAGLFVLETSSGSELRRVPEWTGVVAMQATPNCLLLASSDRGVACLRWDTLEPRWRRRLGRGAPAGLHALGGHVVVPETEGALLVLELRSGRVRGGLPSDFGFSQLPDVAGRAAAILSDSGYLMFLRLAH